MAENTKGRLLLEAKDFVAVVDDEGNELPYKVPKHWGADQLAAGVSKKAPKAAKTAKKAASSGRGRTPAKPAQSDGGTDEDSGDSGTPATS